MFLIANAAQTLARWDCAEHEKGPRSKLEGLPTEKLLREAGHEDGAKIENGAPNLHREVDTQDLFSLKRRPYRHGQLRRHLGSISQRMLTRTLRNLESTGLISSAHHEIEHRRCRVLLHPTRNDHHRPARRYVPLARRHSRHVRADVPLLETYQTQ